MRGYPRTGVVDRDDLDRSRSLIESGRDVENTFRSHLAFKTFLDD